jgi:hypothetical protein
MGSKKAAQAKRFTFKTTKPTGKYRAFDIAYHEIKLGGEKVGSITPEAPHRVRFHIEKADIMEDGNPNCPWRWMMLKAKFNTLAEAKNFVNDNFKEINSRFKLYREKDQ